MLRLLTACLVLVPASFAATGFVFPADEPPGLPVAQGPDRWEHPFSVIAGGGTAPARGGATAGSADLGRVWGAVRDGSGRVVLSATAGTWIVELDGRLSPVQGLEGAAPVRGERTPGPRAMVTLPDGRVLMAGGAPASSTVVLAPESDHVAPFSSGGTIEALGLDAGGVPVALGAGRVQRLQAGAFVAGERLYADDGIREGRAIGAVPGGLLASSIFPNNGPDDSPQADDSVVQLLGPDGKARIVFNPLSQSSVRDAAILPDGRALLATNALTEGELDTRPVVLAAGPKLDRTSFGYGVGEEYYGWISRRRTLLRTADGRLQRVRWGGPPADAIAPDGAQDVLVASGGRVWSSAPGLGAPELGELERGRVGVRLGAPATVTIRVAIPGGELAQARTLDLPAGRSFVAIPPNAIGGLSRVTLRARSSGRTSVTSAWAFAGRLRLRPRDADRVASAVAKRLNIGFEGAAYHGVDRCRSTGRLTVRCRWTSGGADIKQTERSVKLTLSPAGYVLRGGKPRRSPRKGRNRDLLGAPFDASA